MFNIEKGEITNQRQGFLFSYCQIIFNQVRRVMIIELNPNNEKEPEGIRKFTYEFEQKAEKIECTISCVLSTTLFMEAYIFDYCARKKSANYFKKYLDKLDPVSKWVIITKLICSNGLEEGDEIIDRMSKIFNYRNSLVHHKTKSSIEFMKIPELPEEFHPMKCLILVKDLLEKLLELDEKEEFAKYIIDHINSWISAIAKDPNTYPLMWDA